MDDGVLTSFLFEKTESIILGSLGIIIDPSGLPGPFELPSPGR